MTLIMLATFVCHLLRNEPIKGTDFTKMTIYKNWDKEGPYVITEKKVINNFIKKINSSPKEDISRISFEQGPDGRIIFEGKNTVYEVNVFSLNGNVVTDKYLINTRINLDEIITQE
jgi:hypothetical protein